MNRVRRSWLFPSLAISLPAIGITAQQAPTWTAEEAGMPLLLQRLATASNVPPEFQTLANVERRVRFLRTTPFVIERDGEVTCGGYALKLHNAVTGAAGPGFVIYAWPADASAGTRTFAVRGGADVIATDGTSAPSDDTREPEWSAAVAHGAEASLEHVLTALGKGRDGQMWFPVTPKETVRRELRVRGIAAGTESDLQVVVGPACWFAGGPSVALEDAQAPAGMAPVSADGMVRLTGIPAPGLRLGLVASTTLVASIRVERTKDGLEVAFDHGQLAVARCSANESAAIGTLRAVSSAQAHCQASGVITSEPGGQGQYGFFAELAGGVALRRPPGAGGPEKMNPPVLSPAFAAVHDGRVERSGYVFQIFLPGQEGAWVAEADTGGGAGVAVDARTAERRWRCYAWPRAYGSSGQRAFVVDERGEVLATDNSAGRYDGQKKPIAPDAAYAGKAAGTKPGVPEKGGDAGRWIVVQ